MCTPSLNIIIQNGMREEETKTHNRVLHLRDSDRTTGDVMDTRHEMLPLCGEKHDLDHHLSGPELGNSGAGEQR